MIENLKANWASRKTKVLTKRIVCRFSTDSSARPFLTFRYFLDGAGPIWKDFGVRHLKVKFLWFVLLFRWKVGKKAELIPKWML